MKLHHYIGEPDFRMYNGKQVIHWETCVWEVNGHIQPLRGDCEMAWDIMDKHRFKEIVDN